MYGAHVTKSDRVVADMHTTLTSKYHHMKVSGMIAVFAGQNVAGHNLKPLEAMEMLQTCDNRVQALMAEANLLGESAESDQKPTPESTELRQAFASVLIESGICVC